MTILSQKISVLDYGVGNLLSVQRALHAVDAQWQMITTPEEVLVAEKLVLPGVGAFMHCAHTLEKKGLTQAIKDLAKTGKPLLGICVGMQLLFDYGLEQGRCDGLGLISGHVDEIPNRKPDGLVRKIPHIGWSELEISNDTGLFQDIVEKSSVYFVHSFMGTPVDRRNVIATCSYEGQEIVAGVREGSIYGLQFHPEKSGKIGLKILNNFKNLG